MCVCVLAYCVPIIFISACDMFEYVYMWFDSFGVDEQTESITDVSIG